MRLGRKRTDEIPPEDEEDRKGTWADTGYRATDEEAHRNSRYSIPGFMVQTGTMFMVQMKLFAKEKWMYVMVVAALLMPVLVYLEHDPLVGMAELLMGMSMDLSNGMIAMCLSMLPLMMGLFTSIACGTQIPNEFKNRTAYLNMSLPMSRASFYFGKYLAGLVMCLGVFIFAYGMAIATAMMYYDTVFTDLLATSLAITVFAIFAYTSTAFCIGCFMKKGSSLVPFILLAIVIPTVVTLGCSYFEDNTLMILPCFLCEAAVGLLGSTGTVSVGLMALGMMDLTKVDIMIVVSVAWSVAFLAIGLMKTMRREM